MFFFFKQKTAYEMRISDWSSDVCSSDLSRGEIRFRLYRTNRFCVRRRSRGPGVGRDKSFGFDQRRKIVAGRIPVHARPKPVVAPFPVERAVENLCGHDLMIFAVTSF